MVRRAGASPPRRSVAPSACGERARRHGSRRRTSLCSPPALDRRRLEELLHEVRRGETTVERALDHLGTFPLQELPRARVDTQRELRCGFPEVIFGAGKEPDELLAIARVLVARHGRLLATRLDPAGAAVLARELPDCR